MPGPCSRLTRRYSPLLSLALLLVCCRELDDRGLRQPEIVAPGVRLYSLTDPTLLDPPAPLAVQILRLDPSRVRLKSALSQDQVMGTETVPEIAGRHGAIAAINAGFFAPNGDPTGLLQVERELVSDTARPRGAVALSTDTRGRAVLVFDIVKATARVRLESPEGTTVVPVAGIDTVRRRGRLMLFTPKYHEHTDTAARGIEWIVGGAPPTVRERRVDAGSSPIPRGGFVLSFGGLDPPPPLDTFDVGDKVTVERQFVPHFGTVPEVWEAADHVIGGAGLLIRNGQAIEDWTIEDLREGFATERHPRTIIGTDRGGEIWLVTIDGRNPQVSVGMSFAELQRLAARLKLVNALNLDGGGSTTMVVRGEIVNHPSDSSGPRKVSDALLVMSQ